MICNNCEERISDSQVRWGFEEPYCENCFENMFNYCSRCDSVILRDSTHYNDDGDPYCSECYDENYDDDSPNNPEVEDVDRELVINLSRSWLKGKLDTRRPITINTKDILLKSIKDKVGLVDSPIYLFGLRDRDEYQISSSSDLLEQVEEFIRENKLQAEIINAPGCNRLGISLSIRREKQQAIVKLIKHLTNTQVPQV